VNQETALQFDDNIECLIVSAYLHRHRSARLARQDFVKLHHVAFFGIMTVNRQDYIAGIDAQRCRGSPSDVVKKTGSTISAVWARRHKLRFADRRRHTARKTLAG
jgi:hypothetical protein